MEAVERAPPWPPDVVASGHRSSDVQLCLTLDRRFGRAGHLSAPSRVVTARPRVGPPLRGGALADDLDRDHVPAPVLRNCRSERGKTFSSGNSYIHRKVASEASAARHLHRLRFAGCDVSAAHTYGRAVVAVGIIALLSATGCVGPGNRQTMRFDLAPGPVGAEVTERQWFFFWGLVPTARIDVLERCPFGVVAIRQTPGVSGALAWLPTLGLLSSRSTTYLCRAEALAVSP